MSLTRHDRPLSDGDVSPRAPARYIPAQHPSHVTLLTRDVEQRESRAVDAIIVPTAREVTELGAAISLASKLDCTLVVLCSRKADASAAMALDRPATLDLIAVNHDAGARLPRFKTTSMLTGRTFDRRTDTAAKRNIGLALSRMAGWQNVLFLDDDVERVDVKKLTGAAALLEHYDAVGLENVGFEDNSVVCHAKRAIDGDQGTFVGAGALLVPAARNTSFFPDIYNEDWFYLLNSRGIAAVAMSGLCAQKRFDPFSEPDRARLEEFGDCLAEGIFSLLDNGVAAHAANTEFWRGFLELRRELILSLIEAVPTSLLSARREQVVGALKDPWRALRKSRQVFVSRF